MKVIEPGHLYLLDVIDGPTWLSRRLRFVKRIGDKYPGNEGPAYPGATSQEVLRALIERTQYVNGQREHPTNYRVIAHLRSALVELEIRAHRERGDITTALRVAELTEPELVPTCQRCGHLFCGDHASG